MRVRLSNREVSVITTEVSKLDHQAKVFLFGSRADPAALGGDIDLLIISKQLGLSAKLQLLTAIKAALGEQKIDILIIDSLESSDPFYQSIKTGMIELH